MLLYQWMHKLHRRKLSTQAGRYWEVSHLNSSNVTHLCHQTEIQDTDLAIWRADQVPRVRVRMQQACKKRSKTSSGILLICLISQVSVYKPLHSNNVQRANSNHMVKVASCCCVYAHQHTKVSQHT